MVKADRKIIHIDEDKCNGCGLCVPNCAEGALQIIDGKAKLVSDVYCDGLGACLGPCPMGALSIITREAVEFDQEAADIHVAKMKAKEKAQITPETKPGAHAHSQAHNHAGGGCPGSMARSLRTSEPKREEEAEHVASSLGCGCPGSMARSIRPSESTKPAETDHAATEKSELMNWPVQLMLVPPTAPYFKNADLLVAADCAAFADGGFHRRFLKDRPLVIACPKLDDPEPRIAKLTAIITAAKPRSITVARMEVPCCGGLVSIVKEAIHRSGMDVPMQVEVIGTDGSHQ